MTKEVKPKKCMYCSSKINDDSVLDVCRRCGIGVWGERMFDTIVGKMENARERGNINSKGLFVGEELSKDDRKHLGF